MHKYNRTRWISWAESAQSKVNLKRTSSETYTTWNLMYFKLRKMEQNTFELCCELKMGHDNPTFNYFFLTPALSDGWTKVFYKS